MYEIAVQIFVVLASIVSNEPVFQYGNAGDVM